MAAPFSPRDQLNAFVAWGARLRRGALVGVVALAIGLVGTVALTLTTHRLYRSEAVLSYQEGARTLGIDQGFSIRALTARVNDMLTSRDRLQAVIKELRLYPSIVESRGVGDAIEEMRKHLRLSTREGYTLQVSYDGESRELAKAVLDRLIGGVLEDDNKDRSREADGALKFLANERRQADEDLKSKDAALSGFLANHPQLAGEVGTAASGGLIRAADRDRAAASSGDVASLELEAAQIQESLSAAGVRPTAAPNEPVADPALVAAQSRAEADLQAARADLADKQTRLTNEHPDVKVAVRRVALAEAAARRAESAAAASRSLPLSAPAAAGATDQSARISGLRRALAAVQQQIGSVRGRSAPRAEPLPKTTGSMVAIDTEWSRLNRDVVEARERQTQLQSKQFQAELAAMLTSAGEGPRLVLVDRPFQPLSPIAGGHSKIAMAGLAGSLVLALLAVVAFTAFDDRLYAVPDVTRVLEDCVVVVIPSIPRKLQARPNGEENGEVEGGPTSG